MPRLRTALALVLLPTLAACGVHGKTGIPEGREKPWAEMSESERMEHMSVVVLPKMQELFESHDYERFGGFSCATCHGSGAADGDFDMPNPGLPTLYPANLYKHHRKHHGDTVKFMWKEVEPAMGEALAVTYGLKGTLSCGSCHVLDDGPPPE